MTNREPPRSYHVHVVQAAQRNPWYPYDPTRQASPHDFPSRPLGLARKRLFWDDADSSIAGQGGDLPIGAEDRDAPPPSKRLRPTGPNQREPENLHQSVPSDRIPVLLPPFFPGWMSAKKAPPPPPWDLYTPTTPQPPPWRRTIPGLRPRPPPQSIHPAQYQHENALHRPVCGTSSLISAGYPDAYASPPEFRHDWSSCEGRYDTLSESQESHEYRKSDNSEADSDVDDKDSHNQVEVVNERALSSASPSACPSPATICADLESLPHEGPLRIDPYLTAGKVQLDESKVIENRTSPGVIATSSPNAVAIKTGAEKDVILKNLMTNLLTTLVNRFKTEDEDQSLDDPAAKKNLKLARVLSYHLQQFIESQDYDISEEEDESEQTDPDLMDEDTEASSVTLDGLKSPLRIKLRLPGPESLSRLPGSDVLRRGKPGSGSYSDFASENDRTDGQDSASEDSGTRDQKEPNGSGLVGERLAAKGEDVPEVILIDDSDSEKEAASQRPSKNASIQKEVITINDSDSDILSDANGSADHDSDRESSISDVVQGVQRRYAGRPLARIGVLALPPSRIIIKRHDKSDVKKKEDIKAVARDEPRGVLAPPEQFHPREVEDRCADLNEGPDAEENDSEPETEESFGSEFEEGGYAPDMEESSESDIEEDDYEPMTEAEEEDYRSEVCIRTDGYCRHGEDPDACERCENELAAIRRRRDLEREVFGIAARGESPASPFQDGQITPPRSSEFESDGFDEDFGRL